MNEEKRQSSLVSVVVAAVTALVVAGSVALFALKQPALPIAAPSGERTFAGLVHNTQETFDAGIAVKGTEAISANRALNISVTSTQNGITRALYSRAFTDATTTPFCIPNPFTVTSTATFAAVKNSGISTTSVALVMATSTPTKNTGLTTSTPGFGTTNPAQFLNINLLANTTVTNTVFYGGIVTDSRSSQTTVTTLNSDVGPGGNVCGVVGEGNGGSTLGVTNAVNLFDGTGYVEFRGPAQ